MDVLSHSMSKTEVDAELFNCVRSKVGVVMASVMYVGNKTFSWYYWDKYRREVEKGL